jgi:peptidoglycan/LPS O-acetylase OafA/YrhL
VSARRDLGNLGVRIFFVISGFLITKLLIQEEAKYGNISLKHFYLRRLFRIFPPAYMYIVVGALFSWQGILNLHWKDFVHALTYTVNYDQSRQWHFMHLWSLSVEEQFYMLWPLIIALAGWRRATKMAIAALFLAPLVRLGMWYLVPELRWTIGAAFQTNADALAAGCVLAAMQPRLSGNQRYLATLASRWFLAVPAVVFVAAALLSIAETNSRIDLISMGFGISAMNIGIALCIDRCVRFESDFIGRILNGWAFTYVGVLSYSLYLWQEPFLNRTSHLAINWFPINLILTFIAAICSYYLLEQPFLRLRRRFEPGRSRTTRVKGRRSDETPVSAAAN